MGPGFRRGDGGKHPTMAARLTVCPRAHQHAAMRPLSLAHRANLDAPQSTLQRRIALLREPWPGQLGSAARALRALRRLGLNVASEDLTRDAQGRPQLPSRTGLDLSISHSGAMWMMALAGGGRRIGVDVEAPRALPRALEIAERHFPPAEVALLVRLGDRARQHAFLRLWCAREAILKAHGRGIAFGLARLELDLTPQRLRLTACDPALGAVAEWHVREFVPARGMLGAVAWRGAPATLRQFL